MKPLLSVLLFLCCATCFAAPGKKEALAAAQLILIDPWSNDAADAFQKLPDFLENTNIAKMEMSKAVIPWAFEETAAGRNRSVATLVFLRTYIAANVKSQLESEAPKDDPYSGWAAVIKEYERTKKREGVSFPSIEQLARLESQGKLKAHAEEALKSK